VELPRSTEANSSSNLSQNECSNWRNIQEVSARRRPHFERGDQGTVGEDRAEEAIVQGRGPHSITQRQAEAAREDHRGQRKDRQGNEAAVRDPGQEHLPRGQSYF
jgi:hypothetical protein